MVSKTAQVCATQLHDLVELVRGELSKLARRTLTAPSTEIQGDFRISGDDLWWFRGDQWNFQWNFQWDFEIFNGMFNGILEFSMEFHGLHWGFRGIENGEDFTMSSPWFNGPFSMTMDAWPPQAMVTIDVHNRDVVGSLRDAKITSSKDGASPWSYRHGSFTTWPSPNVVNPERWPSPREKWYIQHWTLPQIRCIMMCCIRF